MNGVHQAMDQRITGWVDEIKTAIGAPPRRAD